MMIIIELLSSLLYSIKYIYILFNYQCFILYIRLYYIILYYNNNNNKNLHLTKNVTVYCFIKYILH